MLKSFGSDAGFSCEFPESRGNEARFNIIKCPYYETCLRYGCPEITRAFCDGDDAGYGMMLISTALRRLLRVKTVLLIAHRMRTVEAADHIVVLAEGKVAEEGMPEIRTAAASAA